MTLSSSASSSPSPRTYSPAAVQAILAEAVAQPGNDHLSWTDLEAIAAEMAIAPDQLQRAEAAWVQQEQARAQQRQQRQRWRQEFTLYVVVNAGLIGLNVATAGTITWAIYPLLGWGLGLLWPGGWRTGGCAPAKGQPRSVVSSVQNGHCGDR